MAVGEVEEPRRHRRWFPGMGGLISGGREKPPVRALQPFLPEGGELPGRRHWTPWPNRGLDCATREGGPAGSSHDPFSKEQVADVQGTRRTRLLNVLSGVDEDRERADRPLHTIVQRVLSRRGIIGEAGADTASAIAGKKHVF